MAEPARKISASLSPTPSRVVVKDQTSNELIFAVVGHVGSGTSMTARSLQSLLEASSGTDGPYKAEIIKARDLIAKWAETKELGVPSDRKDLSTSQGLQDLGDQMRAEGDFAVVARYAMQSIRLSRAKAQGIEDPGDSPVPPDGMRRAYIIDSIRHPAEVELMRRVYGAAFVLIGVVCESTVRLKRLVEKYSNAGNDAARKFMERDAKAKEKYGQRVSDAFHMADFFIDNTADRYLDGDSSPNPEWVTNEQLSRLLRIVTHAAVERPAITETAMHQAYGASLRSACLSRQVGAALIDAKGNVIATGTNEVPKPGGGVYGESFEEHEEDHRCAYRLSGKYCSNTREQNKIIDDIFEELPELRSLDAILRNRRKTELRSSRVGDLIEFSRAVHAEMDALFSAARKGVTTLGTRLFVTTFPCHSCARGIITAGVDEVYFIEPYPKSLAVDLHPDAITLDGRESKGGEWIPPSRGGHKVRFRPFTGVAPRLYRRAFLKDRELKQRETGNFEIGQAEWGTQWDIHRISYAEIEAKLANP